MTSGLPAPPWRPLGLAVAAFLDGDAEAAVELVMEDGRRDALPAAALFRRDGLPPAEVTALELARGRVLDVGAGAGAHALALAARGLRVTAIDVAPEAVETMRRRGVPDARVADVFGWDGDGLRFDTILMLMNGLGVAGDLAGLRRLLDRCRDLLAPGGCVLADGADLRGSDEPREHAAMARREAAGRFRGEVRYRARFRDLEGDAFSWLFLDLETLVREAAAAGWHAQAVFAEAEGAYLARLVPDPARL